MEDLGGLLATLAVFPPTVLFLDGDLGAGKTALARGYLRTATANPHLLVTSPTYLLSNVYATTDASQSRIYHMDLYRLDQKETVEEIRDVLRPLDLDSVFANNVVLMEWPERLGPSFFQRCNNATTTPGCSAAQDNNNNNSNNPSLWPILPVERLEIDIRIRQQRSHQQHSPMAVVATEAAQEDEMMLQDVQSRVVTLTPVGSQWRQVLQEAVDDGLVDDFLFPDDDDDDDEIE